MLSVLKAELVEKLLRKMARTCQWCYQQHVKSYATRTFHLCAALTTSLKFKNALYASIASLATTPLNRLFATTPGIVGFAEFKSPPTPLKTPMTSLEGTDATNLPIAAFTAS